MKVKKCSNKNCLQPIQPIENFGKNKSTKDGYQSYCKTCRNISDKKYYNKVKNKRRITDKLYNISIPLYEVWYNKLYRYEETLKVDNLLKVKCTYCNRFFYPTVLNIKMRLSSLNGTRIGENRFYCSEECKHNCSTYNQKSKPKDFKINTSREVQPELRQMVFERDNWTCIKCEAKTNLHCHHVEGIRWEPIESADIDNCITVCKDCHKEIHSKDGCKYHELKCLPAK